MEGDDEMVAKTRCEGIYIAIESMAYTKYEDIPEYKEIFVHGFEHIKIDKVDKYIIIGCSSVELCENDKLFNFWSIKFLNEEIEKENIEIKVWSFMTLVKKTLFKKIRALFVVEYNNLIRNVMFYFLIVVFYENYF